MRRGGTKSFVDDLAFGRGVVLSRAATSLRSIETQPWTRRFVCFLGQTHLLLVREAGQRWSTNVGRPAGVGRRGRPFVFFFNFRCDQTLTESFFCHIEPGL